MGTESSKEYAQTCYLVSLVQPDVHSPGSGPSFPAHGKASLVHCLFAGFSASR